jgi:hypothetical protein
MFKATRGPFSLRARRHPSAVIPSRAPPQAANVARPTTIRRFPHFFVIPINFLPFFAIILRLLAWKAKDDTLR